MPKSSSQYWSNFTGFLSVNVSPSKLPPSCTVYFTRTVHHISAMQCILSGNWTIRAKIRHFAKITTDNGKHNRHLWRSTVPTWSLNGTQFNWIRTTATINSPIYAVKAKETTDNSKECNGKLPGTKPANIATIQDSSSGDMCTGLIQQSNWDYNNTDRQTYRQTDRQTDKEMDNRQTHNPTTDCLTHLPEYLHGLSSVQWLFLAFSVTIYSLRCKKDDCLETVLKGISGGCKVAEASFAKFSG